MSPLFLGTTVRIVYRIMALVSRYVSYPKKMYRCSPTAYPAADIAGQMIERGSRVMIVNLQSTPVNKPHLPFTTMKHACKQIAIVGESVVLKPSPVKAKTSTNSIRKAGITDPPSKKPHLLEPQAIYTKLADLKANTIVNVYGMVKFFKSPFKTRISDQ